MSWLVPTAFLAVIAASFAIFAVTNARPTTGVSYGGRGGRFAGGPWLRDWFYWLTSPLTRGAVATGVGPTALNVTGLVFGLAAAFLFGIGRFQAAALLVVMAGISDALDGEVARALGVASDQGAFIDSSLDRVVDAAIFAALAVYYASWATPILVAALAAGYLGQIVSYIKARGEAQNVSDFGGLIQRTERLVAVVIAGLVDPVLADAGLGLNDGTTMAVVIVALAALSFATAVTRFVHGVTELAPARSAGPDEAKR